MGDEANSLDDQGAADEVKKLDLAPQKLTRNPITLLPWEWQHVRDLAYMVKHTRQKLPTHLRDKAASVWNIMQNKTTKP